MATYLGNMSTIAMVVLMLSADSKVQFKIVTGYRSGPNLKAVIHQKPTDIPTLASRRGRYPIIGSFVCWFQI
jgi:hypothetical protein